MCRPEGINDPVGDVRWVPIETLRPNSYNPNSVPVNELALLRHSIERDGFTQPIVTFANVNEGTFEIVDGFHRYTVALRTPDILARTSGRVPIVVIDKPLSERMASTVRHNRARGKHSIVGMAQVVFGMLDIGETEENICRDLGLTADELVRLKYVTGFAKLFANTEYKRAWQTRRQIQLRGQRS